MGLPILLTLTLLLLVTMPAYPYSRGWGLRPVVVIGLLMVAVLVSMNKGYLSLGYAGGANLAAHSHAGRGI